MSHEMRHVQGVNSVLSSERSQPSVFLRGLVLLLSLMLAACKASEALTDLPEVKTNPTQSNQVNLSFCTDPAYTPKQYVKMIIILDHSGSNQANYQLDPSGSGVPAIPFTQSSTYGTDPHGVSRYGSITTPGTLLNYLSTLAPNDPADPTHYFALIDFNDGVTTYPTNGTSFDADTTDFYNYVALDAMAGAAGVNGPSDGGGTNYPAALESANQIITSDIQSAQTCAALAVGSPSPGAWCPTPGAVTQSSYVIVFMTDGSPIDEIQFNNDGSIKSISYYDGADAGGTTDFVTAEVDILAGVQSLVAIANNPANSRFVNGLNLFTIYYYSTANEVGGVVTIDQRGETLLSDMAKVGNGIAYTAQSGTNINYSTFQPQGKIVKPRLGDVFVTNASVTWWNDGVLHPDMDMDGLPDDIETTFGTSSSNSSSEANGVNDLVNYIYQKGVAGAGTNFRGGVCAGISHSNGPLVFKASDPDGLNDCEKTVLGDAAGINKPDSNEDMIPDWLEFINLAPFQSGTTSASNSPVQDGYSIYQKIKYSLPVNIPISEELNLSPSTYLLHQVSSNAVQDCYQLTVSNLPQLGSNNMVRIDVMEVDPLSGANSMYRVGKKSFGSGSSVNFNDWNDTGEIAAGTWKSWP
jgi:hypothetical protein